MVCSAQQCAAEAPEQALRRGELRLRVNKVSCDTALGIPFNIASAALLLTMVAKVTGFTPGIFTHFMADVHIYTNHVDGVIEMLNRQPLQPPTLQIDGLYHAASASEAMQQLETIQPDAIQLVGYTSHPTIKMDMAV